MTSIPFLQRITELKKLEEEGASEAQILIAKMNAAMALAEPVFPSLSRDEYASLVMLFMEQDFSIYYEMPDLEEVGEDVYYDMPPLLDAGATDPYEEEPVEIEQ